MRHAGSLLALAALPALLLALPGAGEAEPSPAERRIAAARAAIAAAPARASGWNALAFAYARRARETADPDFYARGEEAVARALELAPGDLEAEKTRVWIQLGRHEFAQAREAALALERRAPGDVVVHGLLADANVELGDYEAAERATQAMLDLRPGNVAGLTRAAHLRELYGDVEGALELMRESHERIPAQETEDRAWVLAHAGHLLRMAGDLDAAGRVIEHALAGFPDYHYALAELARVRTAERRHAEAVELLRRRYAAAPDPENLYELAQALGRAGRAAEAEAAYRGFEAEALAESDEAHSCNRELALYYVDRGRADLALAVAERGRQRRRDVLARDAYAWALHASGESERAREELAPALALGVRDALLAWHAGAIAKSLGDVAAASAHFAQSAVRGAPPEIADAARRELAALAAR